MKRYETTTGSLSKHLLQHYGSSRGLLKASPSPLPGVAVYNLWMGENHHIRLSGSQEGGICENVFVKPLNTVRDI